MKIVYYIVLQKMMVHKRSQVMLARIKDFKDVLSLAPGVEVKGPASQEGR
jgi:hypothetical protein